MPQVNIVVNDHAYAVACDDGQEDHLLRLGAFIDNKVRELIASVGQVGEARLVLMAALVIADELGEALGKVQARENELAALKLAGASEREALNGTAECATETLENAAARIEAIAARLAAP